MSIRDVRRSDGSPHDLATELAEVGLDAVARDPRLGSGTRVVVLVEIPTDVPGRWVAGTGASGFDNLDALTESLERHARAVRQSRA